MGSCYSRVHIAGDHIRTNITMCNIEEPQLKYRLGTVSNRLTVPLCVCVGGGGGGGSGWRGGSTHQ